MHTQSFFFSSHVAAQLKTIMISADLFFGLVRKRKRFDSTTLLLVLLDFFDLNEDRHYIHVTRAF